MKESSERKPEKKANPPPADPSVLCPACGTAMRPEHAHYACPRCHYRDSCCM